MSKKAPKEDILLGFNTGVFHKTIGHKLGMAELFKKKVKIVEISRKYARPKNFPNENHNKISASEMDLFDRVSIHAPKIGYGNNSETKLVFEEISRLNGLRPLDAVIVHPDIVEDFSVFENLEAPVLIENMDHRKNSFREPEELAALLEKYPSFGVCLDVNHIWANDRTMKLADRFWNILGDKIKEIHLSGFGRLHDPLWETRQTEIIDAIYRRDIPIIVEGLHDFKNLDKERDYILSVMGE